MTSIGFEEVNGRTLGKQETADSTAELSWWGMALVCATEGAFFLYLIGSYFYLGALNPSWPPAGIEKPKLPIPGVMTALLVLSSLVLNWGEGGLKQQRLDRARLGTLGAAVLGLLFLGLQWWEYRDKLTQFLPSTHAYTSSFFTITGFHGAHVVVGVLLLAFVLARSMVPSPARFPSVFRATALYWHFVGVVWLVVFSSLYLFPRLS